MLSNSPQSRSTIIALLGISLVLLALCLLGAAILTIREGLFPIPMPPQATPSIRLAMDTAAPGAPITVNGEGWKPGDTVFVGIERPDGQRAALASAAVASS